MAKEVEREGPIQPVKIKYFMVKCHICGRFVSKNKPCNRVHNMEKYYERMDAQQQYQDDLHHEYLLEQAGGLDEVQRQERLRYYGEE